ncbi:hypothetical protein [Novosphingobium sp. TH158]|uniref:hypothetical protein n=1 Tax=Novosphingobium sp. TH158 TaxID=2067455 RepID=UPI000C7A430A|nr:hypothetical protein [Novosphingobium sp. TH158]PLK25701.1 hypothetical protein C0V78_01440 [Novosphingobium sp. TH158]
MLPRHGARSLALAAGAGLTFGAWMALADATLFSTIVPQVQRDMVAEAGPLARIAWFARGALIDELQLRLVALTGITWSVMALTGRRGPAVHWLAILLTAFVAYPLVARGYFTGLEWSALTVIRELSLHGAAGVLWGWLCWRHGWLAGLTGHIAAHASLQPLLSMG